MDAEYLTDTLGKTLAKGCAATIAAAPTDPIHYLSLWLLKYVENAKIQTDFWKQKELLLQEQFFKQEKRRHEELAEKQLSERQLEAINQVRLIQNDPYLLFSTCLQAVATFTGCSSAYFALVLDKIWELPKKESNVEEENTENEEDPKQKEGEGEEEEEERDEEGQEVQDAEGTELPDETTSSEAGQGGEIDRVREEPNADNLPELRPNKKLKPPKPPNYKKKVLLYVSATQNDTFMVNKQLTKKLGPVTFSVLLKGLAKLHIANVLYQEDIHFFRGLPRMGAYLTVPVLLNSAPAQALLHILGYGKNVVDDWTRAREVLNDDIFIAIRSYNPVSEKDLKLWELADVYIDGITEEALANEPPIGYLGHQWLLGAKKVAIRAIKHEMLKTENEKTAKDFADAELDQMVAEIDLRVAIDEEKKMAVHLEDLQSKFAKEITMSSRPIHEDDNEEDGNEEE